MMLREKETHAGQDGEEVRRRTAGDREPIRAEAVSGSPSSIEGVGRRTVRVGTARATLQTKRAKGGW